jgi:two-component system, OmpR family, sensor kinase
MIIKSIRWRLQLWLAFLLVCVLSGFGVTVYQLERVNQLKQIDEELERRVAAIDGVVRGGPPPEFGPGHPPFETWPGKPESDNGPRHMPPPGGRPDSPPPDGGREMRGGPGPQEIRLTPGIASLFDEARTNAFYFAVWSRAGTLLKRSTNAPSEVPVPARGANDTRTHTRMRENFREAYHFTELGDCILVGRSIASDLNALSRFTFVLLAAGGAVLALGLSGGFWLATRAIRPVEEISAAASRISAGNLSERISGADADNELGRLAGVLNSTFARLEAAFAQQKQFTADASHELRTPLAVIISEAQTALARERSAAEYRETVEACLGTAQQMRRLTESLLQLARVDAGEEQAHRQAIDLSESARNCVERIRPLTTGRGIQVHCDLAPARTLGDADRLGQVITNLLTNAIHYNKPRGEIRVTTRAENGTVVVAIADTGQGIAAEDLPHIFERFYRADKARSRAGGRSGLGLAICKAIVDADGGSIEVSSQPGVGTTFTLRLPLNILQ